MTDYLDDTLAGHVRLEFEIHIGECSQCADELATMESMLVSLKSLSCKKTPVDCWCGVKSQILERQSNKTQERPWFFKPLYTAPAFALAVVLILLLLLPGYLVNHPANNTMPVPEYTNYMSAHSRAQRQQTLTDPHVAFITAELENASYTTTDNNADRP